MADADGVRRHSVPQDAELIHDETARAERESANGLKQYDRTIEILEQHIAHPPRPFRLRPSQILDLHRTALDGLSAYAGNYRPGAVEIKGSRHTPPGAHLVAALIEDMCEYVNDNFAFKSAVHLSAYVMWRLNWIHPFADGNGRTSRAVSYLVLCARLGDRLPGTMTIPHQIVDNRHPYFAALDAADDNFARGNIDVTAMEILIGDLLAKQMVTTLERAGALPKGVQ